MSRVQTKPRAHQVGTQEESIDIILSRQAPVGAIFAFGGTSPENDWMLCHGQSLLRSEYPDLFTAIGTHWGSADETHFNLPDFRGRFLRGVDNGQGIDPDAASRTALKTGGNTGDNVGSEQGSAMWGHAHDIYAGQYMYGGSWSSAGEGHSGGSITTMSYGYVGAPKSLGSYGTPLLSSESRPKNAGVEYIIKVRKSQLT